MQRTVYTIPQFCEEFNTGKTKVYQEIKEGRLPVVKIGRKTLIRHETGVRWLEQCESRYQRGKRGDALIAPLQRRPAHAAIPD